METKMKCKIVQEMLITEYFDGQMDEAQKVELENHLGCCLKCKDFAAVVDKSAMKMFKNSGKVEPPYSIWLKVKEEIIARKEARGFSLAPFFNMFKNREYFPRAAFAAVLGVMLVIFINTGMMSRNKELAAAPDISGHVEYVNYLLDSSADTAVDSEKGYGTKIEEYFL
jgi:anti-sigma factor RsiW